MVTNGQRKSRNMSIKTKATDKLNNKQGPNENPTVTKMISLLATYIKASGC